MTHSQIQHNRGNVNEHKNAKLINARTKLQFKSIGTTDHQSVANSDPMLLINKLYKEAVS